MCQHPPKLTATVGVSFDLHLRLVLTCNLHRPLTIEHQSSEVVQSKRGECSPVSSNLHATLASCITRPVCSVDKVELSYLGEPGEYTNQRGRCAECRNFSPSVLLRDRIVLFDIGDPVLGFVRY